MFVRYVQKCNFNLEGIKFIKNVIHHSCLFDSSLVISTFDSLLTMQAKKRFSLIFFCALIVLYFYSTKEIFNKEEMTIIVYEELPTYFDSWVSEITQKEPEIGPSLALRSQNNFLEDNNAKNPKLQSLINKKCRMETCFDISRCRNNFKVYIYPEMDVEENDVLPSKSALYQKILDVVAESRYFTADPNEACLFITAIDTLDRDRRSEDYVSNVPLKLKSLKYWNGGRNHLIFNLYSGSWPDYAEDDLGFDVGEAILAKASMSVTTLRPGFDISIPLFPKVYAFSIKKKKKIISKVIQHH